jgi:hypothetical protein
VLQKNFHKINADAREEDEMEVLKNELSNLKENEKAWEAAMKEEKKKLEFTLFDLLKDGATNKDKLKRIKLL